MFRLRLGETPVLSPSLFNIGFPFVRFAVAFVSSSLTHSVRLCALFPSHTHTHTLSQYPHILCLFIDFLSLAVSVFSFACLLRSPPHSFPFLLSFVLSLSLSLSPSLSPSLSYVALFKISLFFSLSLSPPVRIFPSSRSPHFPTPPPCSPGRSHRSVA